MLEPRIGDRIRCVEDGHPLRRSMAEVKAHRPEWGEYDIQFDGFEFPVMITKEQLYTQFELEG